MKNTLLTLFMTGVILSSCKKDAAKPSRSTKVLYDTLMIYEQVNSAGVPSVLVKDFRTGQTNTLSKNASSPFATNLRVVYLKNRNTLIFSRIDGITKTIATLTNPGSPCLTID